MVSLKRTKVFSGFDEAVAQAEISSGGILCDEVLTDHRMVDAAGNVSFSAMIPARRTSSFGRLRPIDAVINAFRGHGNGPVGLFPWSD